MRFKTEERIAIGTMLFFVVLAIATVGGWIANIIKFVGMLDGGVTAMFIARIVGFFLLPLGVVLGYF